MYFGNDTDFWEDYVVLEYEEWTRPEKNIHNGLTVVIEGCLI